MIGQMKENCWIHSTATIAQFPLPGHHYHYKAFAAQTVLRLEKIKWHAIQASWLLSLYITQQMSFIMVHFGCIVHHVWRTIALKKESFLYLKRNKFENHNT